MWSRVASGESLDGARPATQSGTGRIPGLDWWRAHGESTDQLQDGDRVRFPSKTVEIPFHFDWRGALHNKMVDLGVLDVRRICLTDRLGVEVRHLDPTEPEPQADRFPLRIRCHAPFTTGSKEQLLPALPFFSTGAESVCNEPSISSLRKGTQITMLLQYSEVWPGILDTKLEKESMLREQDFFVLTDRTGVELDVGLLNDLPLRDSFPLKMHFRARWIGPQNLVRKPDSAGGPPPSSGGGRPVSASKLLSSHVIGGRAGSKNSAHHHDPLADTPLCDHSMEVAYPEILPDTITGKFWKLGVLLTEQVWSMLLLTDVLGVVVDPSAGIPEISRFPLKLQVETAVITPAVAHNAPRSLARAFFRKMRTPPSLEVP
mmetsp:Transcript_40820/g.117261  ORF Transcript_40820/g.117261 Transcript_40820/m.117261 type:complete len:374 (+) Transcript_40820:60-1181(+)